MKNKYIKKYNNRGFCFLGDTPPYKAKKRQKSHVTCDALPSFYLRSVTFPYIAKSEGTAKVERRYIEVDASKLKD